MIRRFLLLLARPGRMLECIEFDPEDMSDPMDTRERELQQAALKHDVPSYIMGRLTAHFGVPAPDVREVMG